VGAQLHQQDVFQPRWGPVIGLFVLGSVRRWDLVKEHQRITGKKKKKKESG
jgi:hypothetical protein